MKETEILIPWPALMQELSLARTMAEFAGVVEGTTRQLCQAKEVLYYRMGPVQTDGHSQLYCPARPENKVVCSEESLLGASLLNCEILSFPGERLLLPVETATATAVPVKLYGRPVGVLLICGAEDPLKVSELWELGQVVSLVQESVESKEDLAAYGRVTEALLINAVENRPSRTGPPGHIGRVSGLAVEIAKLMDLSSQVRQRLWRAAQYHDVGFLLLAGQPLSEQVRLHPTAGADFLTETRVLADLAPMVAAHHERYDGSGFPRALRGDDAPPETWVLALAENLEEFRSESQDSVSSILEKFFAGPAHAHLPAAVDALGGLLVAGRLEQLLS